MKKLALRKFLFAGFIVIVIITALLVWSPWSTQKGSSTQKTPTAHKPEPTPLAANDTSTSTNNPSNNAAPAKDRGNTNIIDPSAPLQDPHGQFVSNHSPSLKPSSSRNAENSVCITTPGAICEIQFINGDTKKALSAKTTDSNGVTTWNWTPQDIGLSAGNWHIKAVAGSNGATKSSQDPIDLKVQP
jgi:hypothetical protein